MAVRVLIADDHVALRRSLIRVLQSDSGLEVVGEAGDGGAAVEMAKTLNPDVVIMDVAMPQVNGIDATRQIVHDCPHTQVIGHSVHASRAYATRMFKAGASAYVLKSGDLDELVHAVEAVSHGETYLSPEITSVGPHRTNCRTKRL
jgi:DNA-binding NarL/FixJ family response regulator